MRTNLILSRLERRFGKFSVPGLMNILITGMVIVYLWDCIISPMSGKMQLMPLIAFSKSAILHGQVWRIITFVFEPISYSPFFLIFTLYFYWMIGQILERHWGTFRFNLFLYCAIIGAIIAGFISGTTDNGYMIMTMFLAFALIAPDFQVLLFFIIPLKIKYLAIIDAVLILLSFVL